LKDQFFKFAVISGLGWLLDLIVYFVFASLLGLAVFFSNFVSSYFGVTFVYFIALAAVFKENKIQGKFLVLYWVFQFGSIFLYSQIIGFTSNQVLKFALPELFIEYNELAAKILITPFNLATNFIFMKILVKKMKRSGHL
jgi:putative flippase GtrA